jgi:murein DD-endopeptidase MepM/ murein hydrolase activator NlpD
LFDRTVQLSRQVDDSWRLLAGIDLDTKPGTYTVALKLGRREAPPLEASYRVRVASREFPVRRLTVAPEFVNPPAEVQGRIAEEAAKLQTVFKGTTSLRPLGSFEAPVPSTVSSNFGARSEFNGQRRSPHAGVDFRGAVGAPILAPGDGTVALAADLYFTGQTVVLDHGWGLHSILAHLSSISVEPGAVVARGDVVGALGATGRVTGPHLHWAVRLNGARVDPLSMLGLLREARPGQ